MFYSEFKIFGTTTVLTSMESFNSLVVGSKIQRNSGIVYQKNAKGAWERIGTVEYSSYTVEW